MRFDMFTHVCFDPSQCICTKICICVHVYTYAYIREKTCDDVVEGNAYTVGAGSSVVGLHRLAAAAKDVNGWVGGSEEERTCMSREHGP